MTRKKTLTPLEAVNEIRSNNNGQVVLVLQGGGALGAYQGGVYQALHEGESNRTGSSAPRSAPSTLH
jgi:predicted acylesterase/phospholipase RssA